MERRYASYLIRCWRVNEREERFRIEHIQSGESAQVETLAAALAWMGARQDGAAGAPSDARRWRDRDNGPATDEPATDAAMDPHEKG